MKKHKIFIVIARTARGKSTIVNAVANDLDMKVLKSYTTRERRQGEEIYADHIFINPDDVEKYRSRMVAYTDRVGYCSFATEDQLLENDFYIINPRGYQDLLLTTENLPVEYRTIYITVPYRIGIEMAKKRGDNMDTYMANYKAENAEFTAFEKSNMIDYRLLNDGTIADAVEKMKHIIQKELNK